MRKQPPESLSHVDSWVFDLDNTLYDAESHIFVEVGRRMTDFVAGHLGIPHRDADLKRKHFYQTYGTTLRGLMTEHGVAPEYFLKHVHDVDLGPVAPCKITQEYLAHLPGRRYVFTNAPRHFAEAMVAHLGIAHHFDGLFAIEDADYWPKPKHDSYHAFMKKHGVNASSACMFEDMEVNLRTAHDLGMRTVWFHGKNAPPDGFEQPHIHHKAEKLSDWLVNNVTQRG
ncbi:MAG TPA: pyrimidine 5'-nucleotidase [Patescibacteria group bacterium]|nr:pyrimidine 5'-nucleotidase [Patescibacteria group bacterium]